MQHGAASAVFGPSVSQSSQAPDLPRRRLWRTLLSSALLVFTTICGDRVSAEAQPRDVLRAYIDAGIAVLSNVQGDAQEKHRELCALARQSFDIEAFSRLVLAAHWQAFDKLQQREFVSVFGEFLCRYYLHRLQAYYGGEAVELGQQTFKSESRASVTARVRWREIDIEAQVRMAHHAGQWKIYDIVVAGISAVLLYRAQFQAALLRLTPAELIADLRQRIAQQN